MGTYHFEKNQKKLFESNVMEIKYILLASINDLQKCEHGLLWHYQNYTMESTFVVKHSKQKLSYSCFLLSCYAFVKPASRIVTFSISLVEAENNIIYILPLATDNL